MSATLNRASADIGGTFTDIVLEIAGTRSSTKVLTTHHAPERAVIDGLLELLQTRRKELSDLDIFLHGTTLATNAIIERRGALTALVTTTGFRDTIEIGTESRHDQYDIFIRKPRPLVERERRFTLNERIASDGQVLIELDQGDVEALATNLRDVGVESVAVSFIHGYANPVHERHVRDILSPSLPGVYFSLSSEVCPEIREYERASTTVANAYIRPIMASYLGRLKSELTARGMAAPILLMTSGGGLTTVDQAAEYPIRLVESGPAGGAILAAKIAQQCQLAEIISFDMGGTTAKICLIDNGEPLKSRTFEVDRTERFLKGSGLPVRIPVIEMVEIGAGGGSIARVDAMGRLVVGPESASSEPGPACYGLGGSRPTVTDGDLVLGRIDTRKFADGRMMLRKDLAENALGSDVGVALSLSAIEAAAAVAAIVEENMANASRVHAAEHGKDLRRRAMIAFGGAAPMHAAQLARKLSLERVIVPKGAGVGSAIGFLEAPLAYEVVRSRHCRLAGINDHAIGELMSQMREEAMSVVLPAAAGQNVELQFSAFLRYVGQGHELEVPLLINGDGAIDAGELQVAFSKRYSEVFGRFLPNHDIEILTWATTALVPQIASASDANPSNGNGDIRPSGTTLFTDIDGRTIEAPVYERDELVPGIVLTGPLVVTERETNSVVPSGFTIECNEFGHLVLTNLGDQNHPERRKDTSVTLPATEDPSSPAIGEIEFQIMWNRLIAVVEEQAQALRRTAFSPIVRESGDLSAGYFHPDGRMIAQAVTGTPGHVNTMAASVQHFLRLFPAHTMGEGDVYITNDPWMGTGHLHDFVAVTPAFFKGKLVGLFASTCHFMDVGGIGFGPDGRDVFEEGFYIPPTAMITRGQINATLISLARANSRYPAELEGDLMSLVACNQIGVNRLSDMLAEFHLSDLTPLCDQIVTRSRDAAQKSISALRQGVAEASMVIDGYDRPVQLRAKTQILEDHIEVDFSGTSGLSARGINVPLSYAQAYSTYAVACALFPEVPNNWGSLSVVNVTAPADTIVNALRPAPVSSRHVVGQMLPDVVFGCLAQLVPEQVMAEGASALWNLILEDAHDVCLTLGIGSTQRFSALSVQTGGTGARSGMDGLSATAFPSGVSGVPVEILETLTPLVFWGKELRPGSGGDGEFRGGLGQSIEISHRDGHPFYIYAALDRIQNPARGRFGGEAGAVGVVALKSGKVLNGKGKQLVPAGDRLIVKTPGGGGYGSPRRRSAQLREADQRDGLI